MKNYYARSKPDLAQFQIESLIKNFNCEYFYNLEKKDLNKDRKDEVFVRSNILSSRGDKELFVFSEANGKLQLILYAFTGRKVEVLSGKNKIFPQIQVTSEYFRHGGRRIERFQFNGKIYKSVNCFIEYEWETDVKGDIINHSRPLMKPCD